MKTIKNMILLLMVPVFIAGCSSTEVVIKGFVDGYCTKSIEARFVVREMVADKIAPNRLTVKCAADHAAPVNGGGNL